MTDRPIVESAVLRDYRQSVKIIGELSNKYCEDVRGICTNDFESFYYSVCRFPYIEDAEFEEINARPKWILKMNGADCKKKSTLIASWCILHKVPVRFVVMSNRSNCEPHHIYTEIFRGGLWIPADATYNTNKLGYVVPETFREVFEYEKKK